ncbi:DUF6262 family protein [Streptomyces phaeochromogenes]|uniref:DUF6262 family protein n=1 Tax=Streptomyces phaeochromogenes TaxID=1923 RepID=UPI002DD876CC|nr:DUF6262 family protein [Streptomyces phaeochromogenes]WRZ34731.1 hypothetical protein OG931_46850 [Streptomyces phaeochromogenes]
MTSPSPQTAAAIAARRSQTLQKLTQVEKAIAQLRREAAKITVRAIAGRARVSPTFLYENRDAQSLVREAVAAGARRRDQASQDTHDRIEASWRERALNAEEELTRTQKEILVQRQRIGELMGQLRDFEQMVPGESVQKLVTENTSLKHRVRQLAQEHRTLQERLEGARSNNRFAEKRIADLEAQLVELLQQAQPVPRTTE